MRGLLSATVIRRTLAAAAPAAVIVAALALAHPAQASAARGVRATQAGTVSVAIDSVSPQIAGPGATVTVTGTVSNATGQTKAGLVVQLYSSPEQFSARDQMDQYLAQGGGTGLQAAGNPFLIAAGLRSGGVVQWRASFGVAAVGIGQFGVYPLTAQLGDMNGGELASAQTLLPYWPGTHAAGLPHPLRIAWIWPLIDQPQQQVCASTLTNDSLAASVSQGGRLAALLAAGQAHADADLTWFIDPALLGDVATMTHPYLVDARSNCTGGTKEPPSAAAARWLSSVRSIASSQPTVILPYADVDVTALVHQGLDADIASAYTLGDTVAKDVLGGSYKPSIAWPPGGVADLSVLTNLATTEGIGTVVLNSSEMPPANAAVYQPDDAVTSLQTEAGTTMRVLLADDTLTGVLRQGNGVLPQSARFAVEQDFLAQTAMIAAEAPNSDRSVVIAPPAGWSPTAALADDLLSETVSAPWLAPTTLGSLARSPDAESKLARQPPPASEDSPGELSRGYLDTIRTLDGALAVYKSMLYQARPSYLDSLAEALAATESSAWREGGAARGLALAGKLSDYIRDAERKVRIITAVPDVPMGGASGQVPVSIENGLHQAIEVRLIATVVNTRGQPSPLVVGHFQSLITVLPQQPALVRLPISSAPEGSTVIQLSLTSKDGTPLPFADQSLTVLSTRYGRAILFLIGAAIGVLVLTSVYRGIRRWVDGDIGADALHGGQPGSVDAGSSGTRAQTEAPDDLADVRRWVDDT